MVTPLDRPLRRVVTIGDAPYVATISREGLKLVPKGRRKGVEISWQEILDGEPLLRVQLQKSLDQAGGNPAAAAPASAAASTRSEPAARQQPAAAARDSKRAR